MKIFLKYRLTAIEKTIKFSYLSKFLFWLLSCSIRFLIQLLG